MFSFKEQLKGFKKKAKKTKVASGSTLEEVGPSDGLEEATREELGKFPQSVHKLWSRRRKGWEPTPPVQRPPPLPKKGGSIAICLTVVDSVPHEGLWRRWLRGSSSDDSESEGENGTGAAAVSGGGDPQGRNGKLYIHAKHPEVLQERQPWSGARMLPHSFKPEWNDVKVARAMLALLAKALDDDPETQFIYLGTESCVPIRPFTDFANVLWAQGAVSWLPMWPEDPSPVSGLKRADKFECQAQFAQVDSSVVPSSAVWKSLPGWVVFTRHHAQAIVNLEKRVGGELWPAFEQVFAPEEIFFPSMLALAGYAPSSAMPPRPATVAAVADDDEMPSSSSAASLSNDKASSDSSVLPLPNGAAVAEAEASSSSSLSSSSSSSQSQQQPPPPSSSSSAWAPPSQQVRVQALVFAQYPTSGDNRANPLCFESTSSSSSSSNNSNSNSNSNRQPQVLSFGVERLERLRQEGYLIARKFKEPIDERMQQLMVGPRSAADGGGVDGGGGGGGGGRVTGERGGGGLSDEGPSQMRQQAFPTRKRSRSPERRRRYDGRR